MAELIGIIIGFILVAMLLLMVCLVVISFCAPFAVLIWGATGWSFDFLLLDSEREKLFTKYAYPATAGLFLLSAIAVSVFISKYCPTDIIWLFRDDGSLRSSTKLGLIASYPVMLTMSVFIPIKAQRFVLWACAVIAAAIPIYLVFKILAYLLSLVVKWIMA